jgi:alkanesulfonate monooxygenase SsuD/methylene tetrahydromethanopterin reductase-like flavin-dependent oxidoreductase (luciferase family)
MELAVHVVRFDFAGGPAAIADGLSQVADTCEQSGVGALSVMDHYFQIPPVGQATEPMLEGYTTLGFIAARTSRMRLGLLVTGVTYRYPGLLAKIVTTLDVLSGGRAELGIGAAWFEREHLGLGVPTRRSPSGSSGSRRHCGSAGRCGARTTGPSRGSTTSSPRRCARHSR